MANWLSFEKVQDWQFLMFTGFQYDDISDEWIEAALDDAASLSCVKSSLDWEDDSWLRENKTIPEDRKHAHRVAALVADFRAGKLMQKGINLDTYSVQLCRSSVPDGHHRVRALQYLGLSAGPFWLCGLVDELEDLVRTAGVPAPPAARRYCAPELLALKDDDIALGKELFSSMS